MTPKVIDVHDADAREWELSDEELERTGAAGKVVKATLMTLCAAPHRLIDEREVPVVSLGR